MDIHTHRARMKDIRILQNSMMAYLYDEQEKKQDKEMGEIAIKNMQLLQCDTPSFAYGGKMYWADQACLSNSKINKVLHSSLLKEVSDIMKHPDFDDISIGSHINHMLSVILNKAQHIDDLRKLLPSSFLKFINEVDPAVFNIGTPLPNKEIETIKDKFKSSTAYINELCLTKLLLNGS